VAEVEKVIATRGMIVVKGVNITVSLIDCNCLFSFDFMPAALDDASTGTGCAHDSYVFL
jgi:riboflavin synthase alpha subunit